MQNILLSLKLVETFAYNSVYFHNGDSFKWGFWKMKLLDFFNVLYDNIDST